MTWECVQKAGVTAGALLLSITASMAFAQQQETEALVASGNLSRDVLQALVVLGELDAAPRDPTSSPARHAIADAERRLGLPADGIADQALFDKLAAEASQKENGETSRHSSSFTLEDGKTLTAIIVGLGGLVLGFLKLRRSSENKETKSA